MISHGENLTTIECDKCKCSQSAPNDSYNEVFFRFGWALNKGRKYMHLCYSCLPKKSRDAMDWYKEHFNR